MAPIVLHTSFERKHCLQAEPRDLPLIPAYSASMSATPHRLPYLAAVLAIALYSVMDATMKHASLAVGAYSATFWRCVIGFLLVLPLWLHEGPRWPAPKVLVVHVKRGIVGAGTALTFFLGLVRLPLAEAIAISFIAPLIALFLAAVLLNDRPGTVGSNLDAVPVCAAAQAKRRAAFSGQAADVIEVRTGAVDISGVGRIEFERLRGQLAGAGRSAALSAVAGSIGRVSDRLESGPSDSADDADDDPDRADDEYDDYDDGYDDQDGDSDDRDAADDDYGADEQDDAADDADVEPGPLCLAQRRDRAHQDFLALPGIDPADHQHADRPLGVERLLLAGGRHGGAVINHIRPGGLGGGQVECVPRRL